MNSFIGWIGGKRLLRKEILGCFPEDIGRYIEVFGGAGWVLFAKEKQAGQLEVYNDRDGNLVNLYRCIKYHCSALQEELQWLLSSREQFYDYKAQMDMRGLTDIQKAARFFYLIKISFGSDYRTFATSSKSIENAMDYLGKVQRRLQGVVIENKDFDYIGVVYPEGNMGEGSQFLFNHSDIEEIVFRGYEDEERDNFLEMLNSYFEENKED